MPFLSAVSMLPLPVLASKRVTFRCLGSSSPPNSGNSSCSFVSSVSLLSLSLLAFLVAFIGGVIPARAQDVVDLYLPKTLKLYIPAYSPPPIPYEATEWTTLHRTVVSGSGTGFSVGISPGTYYYDHSWNSGTHYRYHMTGTRYWWEEVELHDEWGNPYTEWAARSETVTSAPIDVTPFMITASENQSVDSRFDMRYGNPTFLDHKFGTKTYRGGLFAGFAEDQSRVGRGYMKFSLTPSSITGEKLWPVGGVSLWFERLARSGTGNVATQGASSDSWTASTLTWSNAPVLNGTKSPAVTVHYNRDYAAGQWIRLNCLKDVESELAGDLGLTLAVLGDNESTNAWAYFAKKEFVGGGGGHGATLLYAFGGPGTGPDPITTGGQGTTKIESLYFDNYGLEGGTGLITDPVTSQQYNITGTVVLSHPAPDGGVTVSLSSAAPTSVTLLSSSVVVPEGETTATFKLRANAVTAFTSVDISATYAGQVTGSVYVYEPGGWW